MAEKIMEISLIDEKGRGEKKMKRKILSFILCLAMIFGISANSLNSYAADADNYLSVAEYRGENGNYTAPTAPEGKVFAGWYKDADCTEPWGENITEEKAYAKFVNAAVLGVKWQMLNETASDSKTTDLRLVTTVDSLNYREVGFVLTVGNKTTAPQMTNVVYESIKGWVNDEQISYSPTVFDETSRYFMAWELKNIPNEKFASIIKVEAVWTTLDGTTVYGNSTNANVAEALVEPDFDEGVTFEYPLHANAATGMTRVKYEETGIGAQSEEYGVYGMKKDGTNSVWPHFVLNFGKTYPVGSMFNCKMYVEVDQSVVSSLGDSAYFWTDSWVATQQSATAKISKFNQWVDVSFALKADSAGSIDFFLNFDNGSSASKFGDTAVTIYLDNAKVTGWDFSKGIMFENSVETTKALTSGSASLTATDYSALSLTEEEKAIYGENALKFEVNGNWPDFVLNLEKAYPADSKICFSIYAKADADSVAGQNFFVDNDDATRHPFNQWTVGYAKMKAEESSKTLFLNFETARATTSNTPITVYLDNFYISEGDFEQGMTFENEADQYWFSKNNVSYTLEKFDGTKALRMNATGVEYPYINVNFKKAMTSANLRLCFKVYVQVDAESAKDQIFYVGNDDGTQHPVNQWTEAWTKVTTDATSSAPFLNLNKLITAVGNTESITVYWDDFYVTDGDTTLGLDFENPAEKYLFWKNNAAYTFEEFAGSTAMKIVIDQNWPEVNLGLKESYSENKTLYFKMYAKVDKSKVTDEVFYVGSNDPAAHPFNQWTEGYITISSGSTSCRPWFNFEKALSTIGSGNITLYLDDFEIR